MNTDARLVFTHLFVTTITKTDPSNQVSLKSSPNYNMIFLNSHFDSFQLIYLVVDVTINQNLAT